MMTRANRRICCTIDHIAQTVAYEEMLTWLLFYTSIFETQKTPMVDIIDPAGVVRSQVIENTAGTLRITLNGAENRRTLAGHFMAETFGSGIQHLAFQHRRYLRNGRSIEREPVSAPAHFPQLLRRRRSAIRP